MLSYMDRFRWMHSPHGRYLAISAIVVVIVPFIALWLRQDPNHAAVHRFLHQNLNPDLEVRFGPAKPLRGGIAIDAMVRRRYGLRGILERLVGLRRDPFHRLTFEIYDGEASPRWEDYDRLNVHQTIADN